jgi:hypothetical protein
VVVSSLNHLNLCVSLFVNCSADVLTVISNSINQSINRAINQSSKATMSAKLHPLIDSGVKQQADNGNGGKLRCKCKSQPVEVTLDSNVAFNHACKFN